MKSLNAICGLPRSGSTLLCNVLAQHPEIFCSSTSPLPGSVASLIGAMSGFEEMKGMLIADKEGAEKRLERAVQGLIEGWYHDQESHVFDKGRGWAYNLRALKYVKPSAFAIVMVRDPRSVLASLYMADDKMPLLDTAGNSLEKTMFNRAEIHMAANGLIGTSILGVEDLLRRDEKSAVFIRYEDFVRWPQKSLDAIMERLELDPFEFDLKNIKNQSQDVDGLYLNKYPHEGSGEITTDKIGHWATVLDPDLADLVRGMYPFYCKRFGY